MVMRCVMVAGLLMGLTACSTTPPDEPEDLCQIFREKPEWHEAALEMNKKWGYIFRRRTELHP